MIYFDAAATTLQKPPQVRKMAAFAMEHYASPGRGGYRASMLASDAVYDCRKELAELFEAKPHVFISNRHPLAGKKMLTVQDLLPYPYLVFEQGQHNSFYFSEEFLNMLELPKNIMVRDRATLFNLLIGLNGFTVCSGVLDAELNGENIIAKPLDSDCTMRIGVVTRKDASPSRYGLSYMEALKRHI